MATDITTFDKIKHNFFVPSADLSGNTYQIENLTPAETKIKQRWESAVTYWRDNPTLGSNEIVKHLMKLGVKKTQAYVDLEAVKMLIGNLRNASKEWDRHVVKEMCLESFKLAKKKKDHIGMALAADKYGKYTKCDKDESEDLPFADIIPPDFEPTNDISVLNIKPMANPEERRKRFMKLYYSDQEFTEAEILPNGK